VNASKAVMQLRTELDEAQTRKTDLNKVHLIIKSLCLMLTLTSDFVSKGLKCLKTK